MGDDKLKAILENAQRAKANAEADRERKKAEEVSSMQEAGRLLAERALPRLLAAKTEWAGQLDLKIEDKATAGDFSGEVGNRRFPEVHFSARNGMEEAGYIFRSSHPGYVSVLTGVGRNRGNSSDFFIEQLSQLTDDLIDQILARLVGTVHGFK
ncbi:hypothetical protein [Mesorhizobium sp. M0220]|uniref:hypothetical protein n=1 Tax=Mesorhizobium sp. M0220 TaxID=2956920 RepID=UPI00333C8C1A